MYIIQISSRTFLSEEGSAYLKSKARTFAFKWLAEIVAKRVGGTVIEFTA
jgi:hypothetical protein